VLVSSLIGRRVEDDSLGSIGRVLEVLARELAWIGMNEFRRGGEEKDGRGDSE